MRLAVFGGSYNPIHIGHLACADSVCSSLGYDRIAFVPAFSSPFKQEHSGCTAFDREAMVKLAIADNPHFYCERCELDRQGTSYTVDTLEFLAKKYPEREGKIGLIIGDDLLHGFYRWHNAHKILNYAELIVARRFSGWDTKAAAPADAQMPLMDALPPHITLENELLPLSSTQIRQAVAGKKSWRYLVPPQVYSYIIEHNLYE